MEKLILDEIIKAVSGRLIQGNPGLEITGVTTDSRKVNPGELFIALKGERFDGHNFLKAYADAGGTAAVVMDDSPEISGITLVKVENTLTALGDIARYYRRHFSVPVIGITGSNGKTTTKDLLASILRQELSIISTEANYNNEIGLPLTLFKINKEIQIVVVEMGMRGLGQIRQLAGIAEPTHGIITNVGLTHLELLKTQHNIAKAKAELVESLPKAGLAVLNGDDPLVREMRQSTNAKVVLYGIDGVDLDYRAEEVRTKETGSGFTVYFKGGNIPVEIPIPGKHNILNALAAIATAKELGLSDQAVQNGLMKPQLTEKRLDIISINGYRIIDDTYNASPTSVKAALDVLSTVTDGNQRKVAVLADMLELGPSAADIHREIGIYAGKSGVNYLFAFGESAREYIAGINETAKEKGEYFSDKQALINRLKQYIKPGDFILVKGSRGMKMEEVVSALSGEEAQ